MFGHKKENGPTQPFTHADDCKILKADPTTQIEWVEVSAGHWEAVCACGHEFFHEPLTDDRERLDPYDPSTFRHAGQCEHHDTRDPALLRVILKVGTARARATGGWNAASASAAGRFRTRRERRVTTKPLSCAALSGLVPASFACS